MRLKLPGIAALAATLSLVPLAGCELFVPDLNNPPLDDLELNPTRVTVGAACTGLLIGNRRNRAQPNGYISVLGILGREAYNFDQADPRYFGELLEGQLQRGSPFGGNFWTAPYANIRLANIVQRSANRVSDYSASEVSAILGFTKTIEATDLLEIAVTRDTNGGVIDTDRELEDGLGAMVDLPAMYAEIARLLDEGAMDLAAGGDAFPFELSSGYRGFSTPSTFASYNRAMRARVAAYQKDYAAVNTALGGSFLNDGMVAGPLTVADLEVGVYHAYSTAAGDQVNNLINPNIYAHPTFLMDAQMNGMNIDERAARKAVDTDDPGSARGLSSDIKYTLYTRPDSPVPVIRNEELLLLRAEARFFTGDEPGARADLNRVRTTSGGLTDLTDTLDEAAFITALLYERRYSLAFEGHRWIDARRFGRVMDLPLDMPSGEDPPEHGHNVRFPIPQAECDARPGEQRCMLGSR